MAYFQEVQMWCIMDTNVERRRYYMALDLNMSRLSLILGTGMASQMSANHIGFHEAPAPDAAPGPSFGPTAIPRSLFYQ